MILTLIIVGYVLGFTGTYAYCKYIRNKKHNNDWEDVFYTIMFSIIWIIALPLLVFLLNDFGKPPKWL